MTELAIKKVQDDLCCTEETKQSVEVQDRFASWGPAGTVITAIFASLCCVCKRGNFMRQIILGIMLVSLTATTCFAWDPSGIWGIEGRTDAKMEISCKGSACNIKMQTNYGKYEASGFVNGNKLVVAYNYLTETQFGFIFFEQGDEKSMFQKTLDLTGKLIWSGRLLRQ